MKHLTCYKCGRDISNGKYRLVRSSLSGVPPELSTFDHIDLCFCEECYDIFKNGVTNYYSHKKTMNEIRAEEGLDPIEPLCAKEMRE